MFGVDLVTSADTDINVAMKGTIQAFRRTIVILVSISSWFKQAEKCLKGPQFLWSWMPVDEIIVAIMAFVAIICQRKSSSATTPLMM